MDNKPLVDEEKKKNLITVMSSNDSRIQMDSKNNTYEKIANELAKGK